VGELKAIEAASCHEKHLAGTREVNAWLGQDFPDGLESQTVGSLHLAAAVEKQNGLEAGLGEVHRPLDLQEGATRTDPVL
jgi:hypothetical protein